MAERRPAQQARHQKEVIVEDIRRNLQEYHERDQHDWQRLPGGGHCEGGEGDFPHSFTHATIMMPMLVPHVVISGFDARVL